MGRKPPTPEEARRIYEQLQRQQEPLQELSKGIGHTVCHIMTNPKMQAVEVSIASGDLVISFAVGSLGPEFSIDNSDKLDGYYVRMPDFSEDENE